MDLYSLIDYIATIKTVSPSQPPNPPPNQPSSNTTPLPLNLSNTKPSTIASVSTVKYNTLLTSSKLGGDEVPLAFLVFD